MEKIKRKVETESIDKYEVESYGFNSKGTLTIACKGGTIFNINGMELSDLRMFLEKV